MENIISAVFLIGFICAFAYLGYKNKRAQKVERETAGDGYIEIKYSSGFVLLKPDEVIRWNVLPDKQKFALFREQQRQLKTGKLKIVDHNGSRRLVRGAEVAGHLKVVKKWQAATKKG